MEFTPLAMVNDFCIAAAFLFVAMLLRSKVWFLQNFYIPSSVIAGILGLICGPQILKILPFSDQISDYASMLICI